MFLPDSARSERLGFRLDKELALLGFVWVGADPIKQDHRGQGLLSVSVIPGSKIVFQDFDTSTIDWVGMCTLSLLVACRPPRNVAAGLHGRDRESRDDREGGRTPFPPKHTDARQGILLAIR